MRLIVSTIIALFILEAGVARAQKLNLPIVRYRANNGMRVVLNVDHSSPQVAVVLLFDVGSRDEPKGRTGFAHLFEHMMFQGSGNLKKGDHFRLIKKHGGTLNATTSSDRTLYYSVVPSSQLPLALFLESDRMRSLAVNQKNLDNQRQAVKEERRQRIDNQPYAPSFLLLSELAYQNWAYKHSTIGSMADLDAAKLADFQAFFRTYYSPSNCVLTLSGDFDIATAKKLIAHYFGDIPGKPRPTARPIVEPAQTTKKYRKIEDRNARLPAFHMAWHIPPARTPDSYALGLLGQILFGGKSSRLYRSLVKEKQLLLGVYGGPSGHRGPDLFTVFGVTRGGDVLGEQVRPLIKAEIASIVNNGVPARELQKVRNNFVSGFIFGTQKNISRAQVLAKFEAFSGDARLVNTELQRYLKVSADDIRRVAKKYLVEGNLTVIDVQPAGLRRPMNKHPGAPKKAPSNKGGRQ